MSASLDKGKLEVKEKKERDLGKELHIRMETGSLMKWISMKIRHQVVQFNYVLFREHIYVLLNCRNV